MPCAKLFQLSEPHFPVYRVRIRPPRSVILTTLPACVPSQSCPTLYNPMDCSPPGSSVYGPSQARILERVVVSWSRRSPGPRDRTSISSIGRPGSSPLRHVGFSVHSHLIVSAHSQLSQLAFLHPLQLLHQEVRHVPRPRLNNAVALATHPTVPRVHLQDAGQQRRDSISGGRGSRAGQTGNK